ncbi:MAG: alkaline phosphatase family protein, partial [Candidatus Methanofastidiosia archaeon]
DILSKVGKRVCLLGVPPTYPPKPLRGNLVSCFITPDSQREFTYPPVLKEEIEKLVGDYMFDVVFRSDEKDEILKELYEMTQKRFKVLKYLIKEKEWDLFFFVEIGTDRVHHAFWKFYDEKHHLHIPNNKYKNVIRGYYKYIDEKIGEILDLDKDMVVMVVSDHGAKRMKGCFCINEWLIREGYLCLKKRPKDIISLERAQVDWSRTKAWGWGGYYARIFFNLEGREEEGIVKPQEYEALREELISKLKRIKTPEGRTMKNKIFKPEEIYPKVRGDPPDLMVYFDELSFRSAGTLGHGTLYLKENDTGPDDAVHSEHGIFIFYDPRKDVGRRIEDLDILDIAPTILNLFGLPIPKCMKGKILRF